MSSLTRDFSIFDWKKSQGKDTNFEEILIVTFGFFVIQGIIFPTSLTL